MIELKSASCIIRATITLKTTIIETAYGSCWEWQGALQGGRYGQDRYGGIRIKGKYYRVHRVMYALCKHDYNIADYHIHHLCDNSRCINPDHLQKLTPTQHARTIDRSKK